MAKKTVNQDCVRIMQLPWQVTLIIQTNSQIITLHACASHVKSLHHATTVKPRSHRTCGVVRTSKRPHLAIICILLDVRLRVNVTVFNVSFIPRVEASWRARCERGLSVTRGLSASCHDCHLQQSDWIDCEALESCGQAVGSTPCWDCPHFYPPAETITQCQLTESI